MDNLNFSKNTWKLVKNSACCTIVPVYYDLRVNSSTKWKTKFHWNIVSHEFYGRLNSTKFVENVRKMYFPQTHKSHCLKITQESHLNFHFPPIFVLLKLTCLVTLFDCKLQVFKNSPKLTIFGIFDELLSTQNVNVARFARNVECDFLSDFQTLF